MSSNTPSFIYNSDGRIWEDLERPSLFDPPDEFDKKMEDWLSRPSYPVHESLQSVWEVGRKVTEGVDFEIDSVYDYKSNCDFTHMATPIHPTTQSKEDGGWIREYVVNRIAELKERDAELCDIRWRSSSPQLERFAARDASNEVTASRHELERLLKEIDKHHPQPNKP